MYSVFSVTNSASDVSLLTIEELRAAAGVTGNALDTELTAMGKQVAEALAGECGLASDGVNPATFLEEDCSETFRLSHHRTRILKLSRRPVSAIASIVENGTTLTADDYELDPSTGLLRRLASNRLCYWLCGKVEVTYTAGFAAAPNKLKLAASKMTTALWVERARDPNLKRVSIPDVIDREFWVGPSDDPLISAEVSDLIAEYKQFW